MPIVLGQPYKTVWIPRTLQENQLNTDWDETLSVTHRERNPNRKQTLGSILAWGRAEQSDGIARRKGSSRPPIPLVFYGDGGEITPVQG